MKLVLFLLTMKVSQFHCLDYTVDHTHSTVGSKFTGRNVNSRETHRVDHTKVRSLRLLLCISYLQKASSEIRSVRAVRLFVTNSNSQSVRKKFLNNSDAFSYRHLYNICVKERIRRKQPIQLKQTKCNIFCNNNSLFSFDFLVFNTKGPLLTVCFKVGKGSSTQGEKARYLFRRKEDSFNGVHA